MTTNGDNTEELIAQTLREAIREVRTAEDRLDYVAAISENGKNVRRGMVKRADELAGELNRVRVALQVLLTGDAGED